MPPQARFKSKEKSSAKATKEQKATSRTVNSNATAGTPAIACDTGSTTLYPFEMVAVSPATSPNGRSTSTDEVDDHSGSSLGTAADYDSASNNDSCSGGSEVLKDKASVPPRLEPPTGCPSFVNDKRDKIRQKNERKHQRQKERRAQELHDRCTGYLMSWKLETLSQQLVAMGFSSDRATMALIMNEGRVEESVAWLFEAGEEVQAAVAKVRTRGTLKIDITEEISRMADIEIKFKRTRQEVERAVVACEGNLVKAAEILKAQKEEAKSGEPMDPPSCGSTEQTATVPLTALKLPALAKSAASPLVLQRQDERDCNYTSTMADPSNKQVAAAKRSRAKAEWSRTRPPASADTLWPSASTGPSVSYSVATTMPVVVPLASKALDPDASVLAAANESKTCSRTLTVREPVIVMQRPQSVYLKQQSATSLRSTSEMIDWKTKGGIGAPQSGTRDTVAASTSTSNAGARHHQPSQYQTFMPSPVDAIAATWSAATTISGGSADQLLPPGGVWSAQGSLGSLPLALGSYMARSSAGPSSSNPFSASTVDWNRGRLMVDCDYTNIDWSITRSSCIYRPGQQPRHRFSSLSPNSLPYEPWTGATSDSRNRGGLFGSREQENGVVTEGSYALHDWTSPFAGKDLFSLPRQVVTSPSL
ncbi:unnamed protein product [Victoria cruziana]